jgi:nucleoside-diphosphate-sugar epimerase
MSRRVLITGGAGYIGSVLVPAMLSTEFEVTVLDNFRYRPSGLFECCYHERFHVAAGDCRDRDTLRQALRTADVIIPLAAIVGAPACKRDRNAAISTNLEAVRLLLQLRSREQRILFPTTNSGYGIGERGKLCTEESPLRPLSLYGTTKVDAEKAILDAGNAVSFRLATVFGMSPRMRLDLLVNDFVYRAVTDRTVVLFEADAKRNYLHVRDVARVFLHAFRHFDAMKDQAYNVGLDDANLSKRELCTEIQKQIPEFVFLEAPVGEDEDKRDYIVSNAKIADAGFKPMYSLQFGIGELIKGYQMLGWREHANG